MYLKNTSKRAIVINTVVGKVGIKPHEVADIKYKILPPVSQGLIQVEEEEYVSFCKKRDGINEQIKETEDVDIQQDKSVVSEENLKEPDIINENEIPEEIDNDKEENIEEGIEIQDLSIMGFVNSLLKPEKDEDKEEALKVVETESDNQILKLEQQIQDLKGVWSTATSPRRKEKIEKEIKELQKQLKKLKK